MNISPVSDDLFDYLVNNLKGEKFEALAKKLFASDLEDAFVPLGGMHDGGGDGILETKLFAGKKPNTFYQFSVTDRSNAKNKIDQTINALIACGREPKQLIYATNQNLPTHDIIREHVFNKFGVLLVTKDKERIKQKINSSPSENRAFLEYFAGDIASIKHSAENLRGSINSFVDDPTVFAFLDFELKNRFAKDLLHDRILDSLIYWALRDTDADLAKPKMLSREKIESAISAVFPTARSVLLPHLASRLRELSKKALGNEERVRYHSKTDSFCLPFLMRKQLAERALREAKLQDDFTQSIRTRLISMSSDALNNASADIGTTLVFDSIHEYFVEQGLILAAYFENKLETIAISDQIVECQVEKVLAKSPKNSSVSPALIERSLKTLKSIFYAPTDLEKNYLGYLSRTSLLMMTLQKSPRMIEYFNKMGGNFRLLVGSDLLVKALSEQLLPSEQRQVETLLLACNQLGTKLVLTEPVLRELYTHLHATDLEYRNHYLPNEAYLTEQGVAECNRIFIRAYYYAKSTKKISWDKFINQFLDCAALRDKSQKGIEQLRGLLIQRFKMDYLSEDELSGGIDLARVGLLADKLAATRVEKNYELSHNDALMVYAIYRQRKSLKEHAIYDGFGYKTWWLTKETQVLNFTGELVSSEGGVPYIMRPEFILNFIVLAPKAAHVRESFRELLPTTVGLQLGQHLKSDVMHQILSGAEEWASLTPERVSVMIEDKVNRLKYDRFKRYQANIDQ